jgi:DNA-binding HxlR family transcriptional regulator
MANVQEGTSVTLGNIHVPSECKRLGEVLQRIGDKWTILIVVQLAGGALRFSELRRRIGSISQRMLTLTLRGLERDGIVERTVLPSIPPRVDYELTELGRDLLRAVGPLGDWARRHMKKIEKARQTFDARNN